VKDAIEAHGGVPRRERVGHVFMKKALRDSKGVFGGELSGHFYYRDNYYADSGMITLVHVLNMLSATNQPMSELVAPLKVYAASGEMNFRVEDTQAMLKELTGMFADGKIDTLDGITVQYDGWWFNCRASNTEPLLRLNVEAKDAKTLEANLGKIKKLLGEPVDE
jgi:phosphomannomutase